MNCCNQDCQQGKKCPVRKEVVKSQAKKFSATAFLFAVLFICGLWWLAGVV